MSVDPSVVGGQAPANNTPQAGTPATSGQAPDGTNKPQMSLEDALAALKAAREEAANHRVSNRDLQTKLKTLEDAQKTDEQKRAERLQELEAHASTFEQERQQWRIERSIMQAAPSLGLDPSLAMRLIDLADVKYDGSGKPENIKDLLSQAITTFKLTPAQPSSQQPQAAPRVPATNPARSTSNPAITLEYVRSLKPGDYANMPQAQVEAIRQFVAEHSKGSRQ